MTQTREKATSEHGESEPSKLTAEAIYGFSRVSEDNSNASQDFSAIAEDQIPSRHQSQPLNVDLANNTLGADYSTAEQQQWKQLLGCDAGSNRYACEWCGRTFDRVSNLKRHMLLHSGIKPFKCLYCSYRATQKANVVQHVASRHRNEMRALLNNNINEQRQSSASSRPHHAKHYTGCANSTWKSSKATGETTALKYTSLFHSTTSKAATFTSYQTSSTSSMRRMRRPSGDRLSIYQSHQDALKTISSKDTNSVKQQEEITEDVAVTGSEQTGDLLIGENESNAMQSVCMAESQISLTTGSLGSLQCPWCQKVLSKPSNLKVHIRRHTGEKPYHCLFCPYSAAQKVQVVNHMNARHHQNPSNVFQ
ncbi:hypothetical protein SK128_004436 [Halocaridina rubra]|uniref:C2H2-type domain-containing protein n=1 Tax=Halocaridina rubra TaxID=373956 RepID=A0AAN9A5B9_HALRR